MLGVSRSWLYAAAADGRIPSVRLGGPQGPLRFVAGDIEAWLEQARAGWQPGGVAHGRASACPRPARHRAPLGGALVPPGPASPVEQPPGQTGDKSVPLFRAFRGPKRTYADFDVPEPPRLGVNAATDTKW